MPYLVIFLFLKLVDTSFQEPEFLQEPATVQQRAVASKNTTAETTEIAPQWLGKKHKLHQAEFSIGTGADFLKVKTSVPSSAVDSEFDSVTGPTAFVSAKYNFNEQFMTEMQYKRVTGDVGDGTLKLSDRDFIWQSYTFELGYHPKFFSLNVLGYHGKQWLKFGVQNNDVPILSRNSDQTFNLVGQKYTMSSFGFLHTEELSDKWQFEFWLRYQLPLSSYSSDYIAPISSFDGSIAVIRPIGKSVDTGIYWYGQYAKSEIRFVDGIFGTVADGVTEMTHSNLEFRLNYYF